MREADPELDQGGGEEKAEAENESEFEISGEAEETTDSEDPTTEVPQDSEGEVSELEVTLEVREKKGLCGLTLSTEPGKVTWRE